MGLAASQARLLAITARKMNCEFQSMQVAQQKLSVTRDLQKISKDYQNSLDATKLVWDVDNDNDIYELSYDLMMTPSVLNEYDPYLVTDTLGRILLSNSMYAAAVKAGIIDEQTGEPLNGGVTNEAGRNNFLDALGHYNQIDGSVADAIKNLPNGYTKSGIGGQVYDKSLASEMKTNTFITYMKNITYGEASAKQGINLPEGKKLDDKIYGIKLGDYNVYSGTVAMTDLNKNSLTIGDLLTGKYVAYGVDESVTQEGDKTSVDKNSAAFEILELIAQALGYGAAPNEAKGLNVDIESSAALEQAYEFTKELINVPASGKSNNSYDLINEANKQNIIIHDSENKYYFSLTNMVKAFLTNFAIALEGFDCGYNIVSSSSSNSDYVTDDPEYYFLLKKDEAMSDNTMMNADFYNMLYNQIAVNGAISDEKMRELYSTDKSNLQQALKNGTLFISSLHNDGYFYQGAYTLSGHVTEVTDEDAIARAEIEYNVQKAKLNHKEETLDLQMKNLDMEISSLTTELDSVKNLISKGVEKVFTMFSS